MKAVPPRISRRSLPNSLFAGIIFGAASLGLGAVIFFFNPATHAFYPVCQFHRLTGLNCPGCGATRAAYALLHGHWLLALRDNALFVLLLAAAGVQSSRFAFKKFRGQPTGPFLPVNILWLFLVVAIVFSFLRNLPQFSFLSPA